jgi:hypothetical protein
MWAWIKALLTSRKPKKSIVPPVGRKQWTLDQMPPGDPMMREVMMRALNSGEPTFASRDDKGKVTYHE